MLFHLNLRVFEFNLQLVLMASGSERAILNFMHTKEVALFWMCFCGLWGQQPMSSIANPVPAADGVGTRVNISGNRFDITGGQLSGDQANLFHSFQQFGLTQEQAANFLSNPQIQNILVRVNGGDISVINGLLQVSQGSSNLLFMNPSGIIFGPNATLNLPANFIATTADKLQFSNGIFSVFGENQYSALLGEPTSFVFSAAEPGSILNFANLSVNANSNLGLLGGTVISPGNLSAPEGEVRIATVPGKRAIRIGQSGSLLQLEVQLPPETTDVNDVAFSIMALPDLLASSTVTEDSLLQSLGLAQYDADNSHIGISPGDILVQNINANISSVTAVENLTSISGNFEANSDLQLVANQNIQLRDNNINPLKITAGRDLVIQGNQLIDILAFSNGETTIASGRDLRLVSKQAVSGDAHFNSGRNFSILDLSENPGDFSSLYDPIISANGDVSFGNYSGVSLKVEATGNISGGNIFINGPDTSGLTGADPDIPILINNRAAILRAGVTALENAENIPQSVGSSSFNGTGNTSDSGNITVGSINTSSSNSPESSIIILDSKGSVVAGNLTVRRSANSGGQIDIRTRLGDVRVGELDASSTLSAGGNISVSSFGDVIIDTIETQGNSFGGNITVNSTTGSLQTGQITASTFSSASSSSVNNGEPVVLSGDGGSIELNALRNITVNGEIRTSTSDDGSGGNISLSSSTGGIFIDGRISTFSNETGSGGNISITALDDISTTDSISTSADGSGGNITLSSSTGDVFVDGGISTFSIETGNGGNISVTALNSISTTGSINTSAFSSTSSGNGGSVSLITTSSSSSSSISVSNIFTSGSSSSGPINLTANNVNSGFTSNPAAINRIVSTASNPLTTPTEDETPSVASFTPPPTPPKFEKTDRLENDFTSEFEQHFGRQFPRRFATAENIRSALHTLDVRTNASATGGGTAVVYVSSEGSQATLRIETAQSKGLDIFSKNPVESKSNTDQKGSVTINDSSFSSSGNVASGDISDSELEELVRSLHIEIQRPESNNYLEYAAQLYDWLIRPTEVRLKEQGQNVDTLLFSMESGLRLIPLAALYDRETGKFLAEKYKVSIIPNFGSIDLRYDKPEARSQASILAMGASEFKESDIYAPLNAVPLELSVIEDIWYGSANEERPRQFSKNQDFTLAALREARRDNAFQIVHLATHATFRPGEPSNSSIQLWDTALPLNKLQIETLNWSNPPIDLLILSACQTALGDDQAELGFAGLSLQAEVKSTLASLWYVSDLGSLIYMMEFYRHLRDPSLLTKAAVVQRTQRALLDHQRNFQNLQELDIKITNMLREDVTKAKSQLTSSERLGLQRLQENIRNSGYEIAERLTHPFYWSSFTLVGSPW